VTTGPRLGVVTGLQLEAEIARAIPDADVLCLGPGPLKAIQAAEMLVERGAEQLMSFGIAGGLDPTLRAGDLIVSPEDPAAQLGAKASTITTLSLPALTPGDKADLFAQSGASAVDMETSAIGDVAAAHGLPFMIIRAICDEAGDTIPPIALKGVSHDGLTRPVRVAAGLLTRPQDMAALIALGKRQKKAVEALKQACALLSA